MHLEYDYFSAWDLSSLHKTSPTSRTEPLQMRPLSFSNVHHHLHSHFARSVLDFQAHLRDLQVRFHTASIKRIPQ